MDRFQQNEKPKGLTTENVVEIFAARTARQRKAAAELGKQYGVSAQYIRMIWRRQRCWRETQHLWTQEERSIHLQSLLCRTCLDGGVRSAAAACQTCAQNIEQMFQEDQKGGEVNEMTRNEREMVVEELGKLVQLNDTYGSVCALIQELLTKRFCRRCAIETAQELQGWRPEVYSFGTEHFEGNASSEEVREYHAAHEYLEQHGSLAHDDATLPCISKNANVVKGFRAVVERRGLRGVNCKCARVNGDGMLKEIGCAHKIQVEGISEDVFKRQLHECFKQLEQELMHTRSTLLGRPQQVVDSVDIEEFWSDHAALLDMSHDEWSKEGTVSCLFRHKNPCLSYFHMDAKKRQPMLKFLDEEFANHHYMQVQGRQSHCRQRQTNKSAIER